VTPDLWAECLRYVADAFAFGCLIGFVAALVG
jgi:hypothetical protein